jgi:predicted ATPase/DNA-binding winged helix-turn-helix (wHTH) protein
VHRRGPVPKKTSNFLKQAYNHERWVPPPIRRRASRSDVSGCCRTAANCSLTASRSSAFDVLMALIEACGTVVGKDALMARVWADQVVETHNLEAQISTLRAAFGADRDLIRTVSGRGYQFTGEVRVLSGSPVERDAAGIAAQPAGPLPPTNLPAPVSELIGRDAEIAEVVSLIGAHRLVSLTGAGGIGKTQLALAAARQILPHFAGGVWLAEFSPLADPGLVPATVAAAVGLELGGGEVSAQRVAQALADRPLLLVLDTCEHVIAAAAGMVEALLHASSAAHVIATSREPLKAEGEWIYPVPPLAVPAAEDDDFWRYGAVWLFVLRSRVSGAHVTEDRDGAAVIAAICRRLDGIPLAIELAAARAAGLGVEALAARLDDRFQLLTGGRRTALPRHQTLRATFDWSYELLSEPERVVLRRIAIFAGAFRLEAAGAVVASPEVTPSEAVEGLANLVAKSLVAAEVDGRVARYRLLDTTRAYAVEKLDESGERDRIACCHAGYYRDVFERAEAEWETRPAAEWLADYGWQIDNLRAALDWSFSPNGDASIGVALTAAAPPLWMHLSLMEECRDRVVSALAALATGEDQDARREMKLHAALGGSLIFTRGGAVPETGAAWAKALEMAEALGDAEFQRRSLWGLWCFHLNSGRQRLAVELAQKFSIIATSSSEPFDRLLGERMLGVSEHHLGSLPSARLHLERVLAAYVTSDHRHIIRFQLDLRVMARVFLARTLWLQGFADQATREVESSVEDARLANHANSLGYAFGFGACPITLWVGDLHAADYYVGMLRNHSARYAAPIWLTFGRSYQGALEIQRGELVAGLQLLLAGLHELGEGTTTSRFIASQMAEALGRAGRVADGLAVIEDAIGRSERGEERWATAELLRIKGELLRLRDVQGATAAAEDCFQQALDWARRQGALSWELRAATSFARLLRDQGRPADGVALLQPVYDRFTEGFDTADLQAAKALIDALR